MSTLYNLLGLSPSATPEQIEQAYQVHLNRLKDPATAGLAETAVARMNAIKEAHAVLSSPSRRANYDQKIKGSQQIKYEVVEAEPMPWIKILLAFALVIGGGFYFHRDQENKARLERLKVETVAAEAEAKRVAGLEAAEKFRMEQEAIRNKTRIEENSRRESEMARADGRQIHAQVEQHNARTAREKELKERQIKMDVERDEQLARQRVQRDAAAMRQALSIPIPRRP
jgi:curved DNA-binding protein CbpA